MDKIWYRNPSTSEVIGRFGVDEKTAWPRWTDKSRTLKNSHKKYIRRDETKYINQTYVCSGGVSFLVQAYINRDSKDVIRPKCLWHMVDITVATSRGTPITYKGVCVYEGVILWIVLGVLSVPTYDVLFYHWLMYNTTIRYQYLGHFNKTSLSVIPRRVREQWLSPLALPSLTSPTVWLLFTDYTST